MMLYKKTVFVVAFFLVLTFLFLAAVPATAQTFTTFHTNIPSIAGARMAWADSDRDGLQDLLISGFNGPVPTTLLLRNEGDGTFSPSAAALPTQVGGSLIFTDLSGDGLPDILMTGADAYNMDFKTRLLINVGNNSFSEVLSGLPSVNGGGIVQIDVNGDSLPDLFVTGFDFISRNRTANLYINEGGSFAKSDQLIEGGLDSGFGAAGDLNGDTRPDLFVAGQNGAEGTSTVFVSSPDGSWRELPSPAMPRWVSGTAVIADFDGDSRSDLFVQGTAAGMNQPSSTLLLNKTNGALTLANFSLPGLTPLSVTIADLNGDGLADVTASGPTPEGANVTKVFQNAAGIHFSPVAVLNGLGTASSADINSDGRLDLLVTNFQPDQQMPVTILTNLGSSGKSDNEKEGLPATPEAAKSPAGGSSSPLPDLLIKKAKISPAGSGKRARITLLVKNLGSGVSPMSTASLLLRGTKARMIRAIPSLNPGAETRIKFHLSRLKRGRFLCVGWLDPSAIISETNESNNRISVGYLSVM